MCALFLVITNNIAPLPVPQSPTSSPHASFNGPQDCCKMCAEYRLNLTGF